MTTRIVHIHPPRGSMDLLSQIETEILKKNSGGHQLYQLFRNCTLAVLNTGSQTDNSKEIFDRYTNFDTNVIRTERGVKLELINPPQNVFVDGQLTRLIQKNLFSVMRDILFVKSMIDRYNYDTQAKFEHSYLITNFVFSILRNAQTLRVAEDPDLIVCWGGHSINDNEYLYGRKVGYELGLRLLNICTGCGPGAMEAPMRGAAVGHAQQDFKGSRFIGITEPSIIAAEPPNPLVNELVIMPDIEKRLEAFVRLGHGIIIFPGGVGTAEELLYILGILMLPENRNQHLPVILTGPEESADYFVTLDNFIRQSLGETACQFYEIIIDNPKQVAQKMKEAMPIVKAHRQKAGDAYCFNWALNVNIDFQTEFTPSHENMTDLNLHLNQPQASLAANLRRAFSGIVAGNVKDYGIKSIEKNGPFKLKGDPQLMTMVDQLLQDFVNQQRMKLPGSHYVPCYKIIH